MDYVKAFLIGGALCLIGQILIDKTKLTPARILVSYVVIGVLLGAIGVYEPLIEFAGAGAAVPLTGFGNTIAKGVREAIQKDGFLGIFTGGLKASAGGITAAIFSGLLVSFIFKPKDKTIFAREGFAIVALAWILLSAIGALPFYLNGAIPSFTDAFFETVSSES